MTPVLAFDPASVPDWAYALAACVIFGAVCYLLYRLDCAKVERAEAAFRERFPDCCYPNGTHPAHHLHYRQVDVPNPSCEAEPATTLRIGLTWCCKCSYKLSQAPSLYPFPGVA